MEFIQILVDKCTRLGNSFGFGFWEGFIIYSVILLIFFTKIIEIIGKKINIKK